MSLSGIGQDKIAEILNSENILTRYNKIGTGTLTTKYNGKVKTVNKKDIKWSGKQEKFKMWILNVDDEFAKTYGIQMNAGRFKVIRVSASKPPPHRLQQR